ncbi:MAG: M14 family zinc carboxypeptidase, partial [Planctomycetota bacterium]
MIATVLVLLAGLGIQDPQQRVAQVCATAPELAESMTIGSSRGGQPITAVKLAGNGGPPEAARPGILVLAGAHGTHRQGTELALWQMEQIVAAYAEGSAGKDLLDNHVIYMIPVLNPDGPALSRSGNAGSLDLDRDGNMDEDGHDDLNGDGMISQMRWKDPEGEWLIDGEDPRLMRKADHSKGERGQYHMAAEARDNDGDEDRGEDHAQGLQVHRNFSHRFDEFDRATGPFPMSEPETRALADFVNEHRHL